MSIKLSLILLLLTIYGCSQYRIGENYYSTPEEAIEGYEQILMTLESSIDPSSVRVDGKALIVTPTEKTAAALGVQREGSPSPEGLKFVSEFIVLDSSYFSNYLRKAMIFDSVEHVIDHNPRLYARKSIENYAAIIFYHIKSPTEIDWFLMQPGQNKDVKINIDSEKDQTGKIRSWITDLENKLVNKS